MPPNENDVLERLIRQAYNAPPPSEEYVRQLHIQSEQELLSSLHDSHENDVLPGAGVPSTVRRLRRPILLGAAIAVVLLLCLLPWIFRPAQTWAQVVGAVRAKPWIHVSARGPDGKPFEGWYSFSRGVSADRADELVRFSDYRTGIMYTYDPREKRLVRTSDSRGSARREQELRRFEDVFQAIFRGEETLDSPFVGAEVHQQSRRRIEADGRKWVQYDLTLKFGKIRNRVVFRVDPETLLPHSMKVVPPDNDAPEVTLFFDYPEDGPKDIYALGVPRSIQLNDRIPKGDLARVIKEVEANWERFPDSYYAIVIHKTLLPEYAEREFLGWHSFNHFWRKGDKWRLEDCFPAWKDKELGRESLETLRKAEPPAPGADLTAWTKKWVKHFEYGPVAVCDGSKIYRNAGSRTKPEWELSSFSVSRYMLEFQGYRLPLPDPQGQFDVELIEKPEEGPPGTILYHVKTNGDPETSTFTSRRYWIDPSRGYIKLRYEFTRRDGNRSVYENEKLVESPNGIWYPTIVRFKKGGQKNDDGQERYDQVWLYYVDFNAEVPDSLFKPG
jgi:hypothetical protein